MNSLRAKHWTDDQLIEYLYGIDSGADSKQAGHIKSCEECRGRLASMQSSRSRIESLGAEEEVSLESLLAQRRATYARLEGRSGWRAALHFRRWAPAACALLVLGGGFAAWEHRSEWWQSQEQLERANMSDEQLIRETSQIANDVAPHAAAPLHALFED